MLHSVSSNTYKAVLHFKLWYQQRFLLCRFLYICAPLCGEGKREEAVENISVLWQNETTGELR